MKNERLWWRLSDYDEDRENMTVTEKLWLWLYFNKILVIIINPKAMYVYIMFEIDA